MKNDVPLTDQIRLNLQLDQYKIIPLHFNNKYFDRDFIENCIKDIEKLNISVEIGLHEPTHLERLAIIVLCDSAYIDLVKN